MIVTNQNISSQNMFFLEQVNSVLTYPSNYQHLITAIHMGEIMLSTRVASVHFKSKKVEKKKKQHWATQVVFKKLQLMHLDKWREQE